MTIQTYGNLGWFGAGAFVAVCIAVLALLTGLVGLATHLPASLRRNNAFLSNRVFACAQFAVAWLAYEWLRSSIFTGFPVLDAGYITIGTPFDGLAPIFGVKGVSFAVAFVAAALVAGWTSVACASVLVIVCVLLGTLDYTERLEPRQVGVVQVNIPLKEKWESARAGRTFLIYSSLSNRLSPKDLVVWSEAAFATTRSDMVNALELVHQRARHKYVASGYLEDEAETRFNSLLVHGDGVANYRKHRLVPLGEYIPLGQVLRPILSAVADIEFSDLGVSDTDARTLNVPGFRLAPAICYEASFEFDTRAAVRQSDADAILVVSEDAWFGNSLAPHQNFEMARMRAREHGRYVIRAANSGISGIVGPDGEVIARAPQFMRTTIEAEVHTMAGSTPFTRFGAALFYGLLGFGLLVVSAARLLAARQADK